MRRFISLILLGSTLASCQTVQPTKPRRVVETREAMIDGINPAALTIWDIGNNALADSGALDSALMDEAAWARLAEAARMLEFYSSEMGEADIIRAGGPDTGSEGVPLGVATKAEIQRMIDADPEGFRHISLEMAAQADALEKAAEERNPVLAGELTTAIGEPCHSCHVRYWYEQ